jgi:MFS family permease
MPTYNSYFNITTSLKAVNSTATALGALILAPFSGYICDKRGRKEGLLYSALLNAIGAVLTASAQNLGMFIAGRMIVGLGMGLAQTAAGTYVSETTAPQVRAFALGLYYSCWAIGSIIATGVSYGVSIKVQSFSVAKF